MAEVRRSKRLKADVKYVDPNAPQIETDQSVLDTLRSEALNQQPIDNARRVFEYINRSDIEAVEREKFEEWKAEQIAEEERKQAEAVHPPKFFELLLRDSGSRSALKTLFTVTALMVVLPIGGFYLGHEILFAGYAENWNLTFSGFLAVLMVNIVSLGFGAYAYYEPEDPESESERLARLQGDKERTEQWVKEITRGRMVAPGKFAEDDEEDDQSNNQSTDQSTNDEDDKSIHLDAAPSGKSKKNKKR